MIDLPLLEQVDRLLFAALVGMVAVPVWSAVARLGRRRGRWRMLLEAVLLLCISMLAAATLLLGTLGNLRAYVFVGLLGGTAAAVGILGLLRTPWQESRRRRRT